jgi:phospholipase C
MPADDPIKHIILLVLENRSFDHMLGVCQRTKSKIDGIPSEGDPRVNTFEATNYAQIPGAARIVVEDPRHETPHVLAQLKPGSDGTPAGFVADYAVAYPMLLPDACAEIMKFHDVGMLPALHALAASFTVCDHWFSSVPGPTWANRLFLMSGTSLGRVNMPNGVLDLNLHWYDQPSLFDRLNEKSKDWAIYCGDTPLSLLLVNQWEPRNALRYKRMNDFFTDVLDEARFPDFVFIEPAYMEPGANDDHPSHDVLAGEALIANVYNAVRSNEDLWKKSLLIILFDEHGGFYDHVQPPSAVPPDHHQEEYTFDRMGVRVPAILVSPWVANDVIQDVFDHTSLLRYFIEKWQLGSLGDRAAQANTFTHAFLAEPQNDGPPSIPLTPAKLAPAAVLPRKPLTDHQAALVSLSHALETMSGEDATVVAERSRQIVTGPQSQIDAAVDRFDAFLKQRAAAPIKAI